MIHTVASKNLLIMHPATDEEEFYDSQSDIEESIDDAEINKNDPITDEEESYDSHSGIEESIDGTEMNKNNPVTRLKVKLHHDAQNGNQAVISHKNSQCSQQKEESQ